MDWNRSGQHHADRYCAPKEWVVDIRDPLGIPTGHTMSVFQAYYFDGRGIDTKLRLDHHEFLYAKRLPKINGLYQRLVFHRGGWGYNNPMSVPYGHILLNDLAEGPGKPVLSGEDRGEYAPGTPDVYRIKVTQVPIWMLYKADPNYGATWRTYGDLGARNGGNVHYAPLLWSFLNVRGGGLVRAVLREDTLVRLCHVPKIKLNSLDTVGNPNGEITGAYVKVGGKSSMYEYDDIYGWIVWSHNEGAGTVPHVQHT